MDAGESKGNDGEIFSVTVPSGSRRARERGRKSLLPVGHFTLKGQNGPDTLHRRKIQRFDSKIALFTIRGFSKSSRPSSSAYTTNGSLLQLSDINQIFSAFCPCQPPSSQLRPLTSP